MASADPFFRDADRILRLRLGIDDPWTIQNSLEWAKLLAARSHFNDAEQKARQAVASFTKRWGPDHPWAVSASEDLAGILLASGKMPEAETLLRRALELRRKRLPALHPNTFETVLSLAKVLLARQEFPEAERLLRETIDDLRTVSPSTAVIASRASRRYYWPRVSRDKNGLTFVEPLIIHCHDVLSNAFGPDDQQVVDARARIAHLYESWGKPDQARDTRATGQPASCPPSKRAGISLAIAACLIVAVLNATREGGCGCCPCRTRRGRPGCRPACQ